MVKSVSIAVTMPFVGSGLASALSLFNMKNAPAPPPPSTTRAITMIISIFLDFLGVASAVFSSLIGTPPHLSVVGPGGGDAGVQLAVGTGRGRQKCGLVGL